MNDQTWFIVLLGLCLGMVFGLALGYLLCASDHKKSIEKIKSHEEVIKYRANLLIDAGMKLHNRITNEMVYRKTPDVFIVHDELKEWKGAMRELIKTYPIGDQ